MFTQLHIFCVFLWVINPLVTPMWGRPNITPISIRMKSFENIIITNFCRSKNYYFCSWLVVIDGVPAIGEQRFCQRGTAGGNLPHRSHWRIGSLGSLPFVRHRRPLVPLRFVWTSSRRRQGPPLVHGASLLVLLLRLWVWADQTDIPTDEVGARPDILGGQDGLFSHRPACCPLFDLVSIILGFQRSCRNSWVNWFWAEVERGIHWRFLFLVVSCSFFSWGLLRSLSQKILSAPLLPAPVWGSGTLLCSGRNSFFTWQRKWERSLQVEWEGVLESLSCQRTAQLTTTIKPGFKGTIFWWKLHFNPNSCCVSLAPMQAVRGTCLLGAGLNSTQH